MYIFNDFINMRTANTKQYSYFYCGSVFFPFTFDNKLSIPFGFSYSTKTPLSNVSHKYRVNTWTAQTEKYRRPVS